METSRYEKKLKLYLAISLTVGLLLLVTGVLFSVFDIHIIQNNKAIIGVSFIPFGLAFAFSLNLAQMKKNPKGMRPILVAENDERLSALKHQADSIAFGVLRYTLTLLFFVYTFAYPSDVFETAGWWVVFGFLFLAFFLQPVILKVLQNKNVSASEDE